MVDSPFIRILATYVSANLWAGLAQPWLVQCSAELNQSRPGIVDLCGAVAAARDVPSPTVSFN